MLISRVIMSNSFDSPNVYAQVCSDRLLEYSSNTNLGQNLFKSGKSGTFKVWYNCSGSRRWYFARVKATYNILTSSSTTGNSSKSIKSGASSTAGNSSPLTLWTVPRRTTDGESVAKFSRSWDSDSLTIFSKLRIITSLPNCRTIELPTVKGVVH